MRVTVEICVESLEEARTAERAGAHRIELCTNLAQQGTTPGDSLMASCVAEVGIPVFVMVRPRPGDFHYGDGEVREMCDAIHRARHLGAAGIVSGALAEDLTVDCNATATLLQAAAPLPFTFHRAFDRTRDVMAALDSLAQAGVQRVLTAGAAATAADGAGTLHALVARAQGRIGVLAAGSIRPHNVVDIVRTTGVREVHARFTTAEEVARLCHLARSL